MLITKEIEIDMGHRVPNHKSKCRNLHGHRYKIEVGVNDKVIADIGAADEGMVIDFGDLKQTMMEVLDQGYDHGFVMHDKDVLAQIFVVIKNGGEILQRLINGYRELVTFVGLELEPKDLEPMKIVMVPFVPTAENLAKHWYEEMEMALQRKNIKLAHIKIWETPTSTAVYTGVE